MADWDFNGTTYRDCKDERDYYQHQLDYFKALQAKNQEEKERWEKNGRKGTYKHYHLEKLSFEPTYGAPFEVDYTQANPDVQIEILEGVLSKEVIVHPTIRSLREGNKNTLILNAPQEESTPDSDTKSTTSHNINTASNPSPNDGIFNELDTLTIQTEPDLKTQKGQPANARYKDGVITLDEDLLSTGSDAAIIGALVEEYGEHLFEVANAQDNPNEDTGAVIGIRLIHKLVNQANESPDGKARLTVTINDQERTFEVSIEELQQILHTHFTQDRIDNPVEDDAGRYQTRSGDNNKKHINFNPESDRARAWEDSANRAIEPLIEDPGGVILEVIVDGITYPFELGYEALLILWDTRGMASNQYRRTCQKIANRLFGLNLKVDDFYEPTSEFYRSIIADVLKYNEIKFNVSPEAAKEWFESERLSQIPGLNYVYAKNEYDLGLADATNVTFAISMMTRRKSSKPSKGSNKEGRKTNTKTSDTKATNDKAIRDAAALKRGQELGRIYEPAPYHTTTGNPLKSRRPTDPQPALNNSIELKSTNERRRLGLDPINNEIIYFDRDRHAIMTFDKKSQTVTRNKPEVYHGHVRSFDDLPDNLQKWLRKEGFVDKKGNVIKSLKE